MGVFEMRFAFERAWQAQEGLDVARAFVADGIGSAVDVHLDGMEVTFAPCAALDALDLDDGQSFFKQLCFHWATRHSDTPFTGMGCVGPSGGRLSAEKVFYDGYVLGFKHLECPQAQLDERAWCETRWDLWIPLHGHFVNLEEWRMSSDL